MTIDHHRTDARRVERDGLRIFWNATPGPCVGALLVRSGKVDETLRTSGINHLVEHMALFPIGRPAYDYNGRVEDAVTMFYAQGEPEEVAGFLRAVGEHLTALPADRLETERRILATEADGRDAGVHGRLLGMRFGARGYGLTASEELGIGWLGADDVQRWADERFTRENAVVWMSAEPPEDFDVPLRSGAAHPAPAPVAIPSLVLPAEIQSGTGGVALTTVLPRSTALHAGWAIAAGRAHDLLRREEGLSYSVSRDYLVLDGHQAHLTLQADCNDLDAAKVRDRLLQVLDDLAEHGPTEEELERDRRAFVRMVEDPATAKGQLDSDARDVLLGVPATSADELLREREELTPATVAEAIAAGAESLLSLIPSGTSRSARFTEYAVSDKTPVQGTAYDPTPLWRAWGDESRLVVGDEGVTTTADAQGTDPLTVRFDSAVAAVEHQSGKLTVVDQSGAWVAVTPLTLSRGAAAAMTVRERMGEDRIVPLTTREQELAPIVAEQLGDAIERVPREVDALAAMLAADERVDLLATATRGQMTGLVVVTDRRFLYAAIGWRENDVVEVPREEVSAQTKGLRRKRLVVSGPDATFELVDVLPEARLREIAIMLS